MKLLNEEVTLVERVTKSALNCVHISPHSIYCEVTDAWLPYNKSTSVTRMSGFHYCICFIQQPWKEKEHKFSCWLFQTYFPASYAAS